MKRESEKQIMVGGDEHTLSKAMTEELKNEGYRITFARSRQDLMDKATDSSNVWAVIIDGDWKVFHFNNMVEEICKRLKTRPLFILTAHYSITAVVQAFQTGFHEFLAKPLGIEELLALFKKKI